MTISILSLLGTSTLRKNTIRETLRPCFKCENFPFEIQTKLYFLMCNQSIYFLEETQKAIGDVNGDVFCPGEDNKGCDE